MIGAMRRCREIGSSNGWGNVSVDIFLEELNRIYGAFNDSESFPLFENNTPPANDGLSKGASGCELCNCLSGNFVRSGTFEGPFAGYRNVLPDLTPGEGFINVGKTVFRAPDGFPPHLQRWFYFGKVATLIKSWRVAGPSHYLGGEEFKPGAFAQPYAPAEPRTRVGYIHKNDGVTLDLGNKDQGVPPSPFILSYTTINGIPLFDLLGGRDNVLFKQSLQYDDPFVTTVRSQDVYQRDALSPVAFGETITIEYWLNRAMADWQPYWHTMQRQKSIATLDKSGWEVQLTGEIETAQEVGEWEWVETEDYAISVEWSVVAGRLVRKPVYRRLDVKVTHPTPQNYIDPGYFDERRRIGDWGWETGLIDGVPEAGGIVRATYETWPTPSLFNERWVSLSGDYVEPVIEVVDGENQQLPNRLQNQHPCMYPIRVSQSGYHAPQNPLP